MYMMFRDVAMAATMILGLWYQASESAKYAEGRNALDRGEWREAAEAFGEVGNDDAGADAALYWQAYAYNKLGETIRTLDLVATLEQRYPQSEWRDDARALASEAGGASARTTGAATADGDEELKLMALNGLMHTDPAEALPILREFLSGEHSLRLKERALFVLAQSGTDEGYGILAETARGSDAPELQRKALRYLGVHNSPRSLELLEELYGSLPEREAREVILRSFMIAGEKGRLLELARSEPDEELRGRAIRLLGAMNASDELWDLYQAESSEEVRRRILQGFMAGGDTERLLLVARNEAESEELRGAAVRLLGTQDASDELWMLYGDTDSVELKTRILRGLFIAGDVDRIAGVARDESAPSELREAAIHNLGVSGESARPILLEMYRGGAANFDVKNKILHSLFIQEAVDALIEIAKAEPDVELKKKAVHWLSLMDSPAAKDYMLEILRR